jgi:tRNA A-37 threonylcarbamoyl transferase component Bud32
MDKKSIRSILLDSDFVGNDDIEITPLTGGVSSDICLIIDKKNRFVFKQAREKLIVKDEWHADVSRNVTEQNFIDYMQTHIPGSVPKMLYRDEDRGFFIMEYLGDPFKNWKNQLLKGQWDPQTVSIASDLLSKIHRLSYDDKSVKGLFDTTNNFLNLRIEPYLITTGNRHPSLKKEFYNEADRLLICREALVHGDFSPKNIMVKSDTIKLLDHEVAWYGDPAFDLAFFLNHLYLKTLYHHNSMDQLPDLPEIAWNVYSKNTGSKSMIPIGKRFGKLLLMLMLARVDGKSPVDYLSDNQKHFMRSFVYDMFDRHIFTRNKLHSQWLFKLNNFSSEN